MSKPIPGAIAFLLLLACNANSGSSPVSTNKGTATENPFTKIEKIPLPAGFVREVADAGSFTSYLRNIGLKAGTTVYLYNGQPKQNQSAQFAILNISTGNTDLQQCADAVIRLRAEYLFEQKQFDKIIFYDNDKKAYSYLPPYTRDNFDKYLNHVFAMCGSASLSKQLRPVAGLSEIQAGDVLIRGGFPGHAVLVIDVAVNGSGKKIYLLAQSYMPAQDIHVLVNPINAGLSPWYEVNDDDIIKTPEYSFTKHELKRW